jgi:hypothetical protein
MKSCKRGIRAMVLGSLVTAGLALAPAAFAYTSVGIGINTPGVSVGYYGGHRHGGYIGINGGYYGGYYGPTYYSPYYYDRYYYGYTPAYYGSCWVRGHHDRYGYWHPGHYVPC